MEMTATWQLQSKGNVKSAENIWEFLFLSNVHGKVEEPSGSWLENGQEFWLLLDDKLASEWSSLCAPTLVCFFVT
jgi:hypothetical protein